MSYRVQISSVKPTGSDWYSNSNPAGYEAWQNWFRTMPGVINVTKTKLNTNTIIRSYEFIDEAAYLNAKALSLTSQENLERMGYNESHGIVSTTTFG